MQRSSLSTRVNAASAHDHEAMDIMDADRRAVVMSPAAPLPLGAEVRPSPGLGMEPVRWC